MSLKDLPLNRDKITSSIESFQDGVKIINTSQIPHGEKISIKIPGQQHLAMLCLYYNKEGNTTLHYGVGKNQESSELIAKHIVAECQYKSYENKTLYLKKITNDEFNDLIELVKGYGVTVNKEKELQLGTQYKLEWKDGGSLFLNHFNSGSLQVQGSSIILKSIIIELLTELLPYKEVIEMQLKSYEAETTTDEVLIQLKNILPNAYGYLGESLIAILSPSIALKSLDINLTDYSAFAFPVLRGLEGYIKKLMLDNGIIIESNSNMGSFIETQLDKTVKVIEKFTQQINNNDVIYAVEESYLYYKDKRHSLFHIDGTIVTTQILTKKQQAVDIIDEVFSIIETTYSKVLKNKK